MSFVLVFLAVALADVVWSLYFMAMAARQAFAAAAWSAGIIALSAFSTVQYVSDRRLVWAALAGAFVGTFLTLKFKKADK